MFEFTAADLINLRRFYKRAPKAFGRAVVGMLNNVAFDSRFELLEAIDDQMNVRNRGFVTRHMRVEKAKGDDISRAVSVVGSIAGARFTGWVEQETGQPDKRNRVYSLLSRGGSETNKVKPGRTRKSSNRILRMGDFDIDNAASDTHRLIIFLQIMDRDHRGKMFWVRQNYKKLQGDSVYSIQGRKGRKRKRKGFSGGGMKRISSDDPMRTKKDPWMKPTIQRTVTQASMRKAWGRSVAHQVKRIK